MNISFYDAAGTCLFVRSDMEEWHWTQEEMTVNATFPFDAGKVITRGMRILFADPALGDLQLFEIRKITNIEPEHYQQIIAEHVVISELSDEHINQAEITGKTPAQALGTVLTGTQWAVGNVTATNTSDCDISRGSVWQAVGTIKNNWNVYIEPRVTLNADGSISGRYLDIKPAQGTWRGLRLSVDKNMSDSSVVYDDSQILTALYGYGGNVEVNNQDVELTFADEVWTATADHPAKPAGQTYIEDPAATALYGRNGRPRFGYYQNGDIKDAAVLLEKTWEALKQTREPRISISGTTTDLKRLGYTDVPLRLHDIAIVDVPETGEKFQKQVIRLDVDLINADANRPEVGDYIPNIIYINRETADRASGGGGGGGRGQTNAEKQREEFHTEIEANKYQISLRATQEDMDTVDSILRQAGMELNAQGVLVYATDNANMLQSKMNVQADQISLVVEGTGANAHIKAAQITTAINSQTGQSIIKLSANVIDVDGLLQTQAFQTAFANIDTLVGNLDVYGAVSIGGALTVDQIIADGYTFIPKTKTVVTEVTVGTAHDYVYHDQYGQEQLANGKLVTAVTTDTISYLGEQVSS